MSLGKSALTRLFLLIALAFGVACMHTLGHDGFAGHDQTMAAGHGMAASMILDTQVSGNDSPSPMTGMDPFAVCLAILGLTALIVVMLLRWSAGRACAAIGRLLLGVFASSGRGPPGRPSIGLHLADLSVMRT